MRTQARGPGWYFVPSGLVIAMTALETPWNGQPPGKAALVEP